MKSALLIRDWKGSCKTSLGSKKYFLAPETRIVTQFLIANEEDYFRNVRTEYPFDMCSPCFREFAGVCVFECPPQVM